MKNKMLITLALAIAVQVQAQLKPVAYADGKQKLNGLAIAPEKGIASKAGILVLPAWKGIDAHAKDTAEKLSKLGYYAFVADIYGEGNYPKDSKEAGEKAGYYKKNYQDYQRRISLALEQLIKSGANADKIVMIGYCFGGTGVLEAARAGMPVKGVVSFHGGLGKDPARPATNINTKILVCHGADEIYVPKAEVDAFQQEMRDSKADWQMVYYADAVHSFTDTDAGSDKSTGAAYNAKADKRSWQHMLAFLDEVLK
jgi:dienelactone hydrolase